MKKLFYTLIICFLNVAAYSQSVPKLIRTADELYENDRYLDAIEFYEKVVGLDRNNHEAKFKLAECFNRTLQYDEAKIAYLSLSSTSNHAYRSRSLYSYANLLKQESKFKVADSIYNFLISIPDTEAYLVELSRKQKEGCQLALRQSVADRGFVVRILESVSSDFHDFGAVLNPSNKQLVFATTRNLPGVQYEGSQYEGLLPDLVSFEDRGNNRWRMASSAQRFDELNTKWAEGSGSFTKDGSVFYYSSCKGGSGSECLIMVSYLENDRWSAPVALNKYINEEGSENKQPSISATGDTLFFSSNRSGGVGGSDIWMSLKGLKKESWTPAINMGEVINTPENEITPYYSSAFEGLLFASNGHVGYGGYDLYATKGESFFEPQVYNLGDPFNSTWDDTYFAISDTVGFLSSNRVDHELLDIYNFPVSNERLFLSLLISGESLIDSRLASKYKDVSSLDLVTFRVEDYAGYDLFEPIRPSKPKPKILEDGSEDVVQVASEVPYEKLYFDYGSSNLRSESKVSLDKLAAQIAEVSFQSIDVLAFTDSIGSDTDNLRLSESRGSSVKTYLASLGIDSSRINVLPRGEIPASESDHWFGRIFKRRVELIIKTSEELELNALKTYILRKNGSLEKLASNLSLDLAELVRINGVDGKKELPAGSTIKVLNSENKELSIRWLVGEEDLHLFPKES